MSTKRVKGVTQMGSQVRVVITRDCDNEYRVPSPDGSEAGAYYTDDREDAHDTARLIFEKHGKVCACVFCSVTNTHRATRRL